MFVAVKSAGAEEDGQEGIVFGGGIIFGGGGIALFELHVGSEQSFGVADILTIVLMIWLLGMIIKGRKSKSETAENIVAPALDVAGNENQANLGQSEMFSLVTSAEKPSNSSDGEPYILCRECLIQKTPSSFESSSNDVCIECQQES